MDNNLQKRILDTYSDLAPDEARRDELAGMLKEMWRECRTQRAFGYSNHQLALVPKLPDLFGMVRRLIDSPEGFQRFCRAMPAILKWLPYSSEESPVGYFHTIITGPFDDRAQACRTLDEFIQGFEGDPVSVCPQCGRDMAVRQRGESYSVTCTCGFLMVC